MAQMPDVKLIIPQPKTFVFDICHPGESEAGIRSYTEVVRVTLESGAIPDDFVAFMKDSLEELYDGAKVESRNYDFLFPAATVLNRHHFGRVNDLFFQKYMDSDVYLHPDGRWSHEWVNGEIIEAGKGIQSLYDHFEDLERNKR